jgi:hypothetical protein
MGSRQLPCLLLIFLGTIDPLIQYYLSGVIVSLTRDFY